MFRCHEGGEGCLPSLKHKPSKEKCCFHSKQIRFHNLVKEDGCPGKFLPRLSPRKWVTGRRPPWLSHRETDSRCSGRGSLPRRCIGVRSQPHHGWKAESSGQGQADPESAQLATFPSYSSVTTRRRLVTGMRSSLRRPQPCRTALKSRPSMRVPESDSRTRV